MTTQTIIELLARREGFDDFKIGFFDPEGFVEHWNGALTGVFVQTGIRAKISDRYRTLDALQPVLATLSEEEWVELNLELAAEFIRPPIKIENVRRHVLTMKADRLALCIAKAIEKKGEE